MPLGAGGKSWIHFSNGVDVGDNLGSITPIFDNRQAVTKSNAGNNTLTAAEIYSGIYLRDCNAGARSDTTPTATQLRDYLVGSGPAAANKGLVVGSAFRWHVRNTTGTAQTLTILGGTGVTVSGTATIAQSNAKDFLLVFTNVSNSPAATLYSLGTVVF
jgi:hypothetical protein